MNQLCSAFLLSLIALQSVYANEYRSNDKFFFLFTTSIKNVHENYAFCSKFGMSLININRVADEDTVRNQENTNIKWIWIESTFREPNMTCESKCCSLQMMANAKDKDAQFRFVPCSDSSGFIACQQVSKHNEFAISNSKSSSHRISMRSVTTFLCSRTSKKQFSDLIK